MGKQIGLILVVLFVTTLQAQELPLSYKKVDSETYDLFLKKDWKQLLELGKKSRSEGIDFYYLKVRMGIAYFKEGKMLLAVKMLEAAYEINKFDVVVQDYLYWAYRYAGLFLESDVFYTKMSKQLQDQIKLEIRGISAIDFGVVTTNNLDYDKLLIANNTENTTDKRNILDSYQLFMLGINHRFSNYTNFYHRITVMPRNSMQQENISGEIVNSKNSGTEVRYYANATFVMEKRLYLDLYLNYISGSYDDLSSTASNNTLKYKDVVLGVAISKANYYYRNSVNLSYATLNGLNQLQAGYTLSLYPLGNTLFVPFGAIQFQNESFNSNNETRTVYTGGFAINTKDVTITGYVNTGELRNFVANNGSIVYNQLATASNEYGLLLHLYLKKAEFKIGYSYMNMTDAYYTDDFQATTTFKFNQQNIIGGITWKL